MLRIRQVRYLRLSNKLRQHASENIRTNSAALDQLIRLQKNHFARKMGIRRLTYHLRTHYQLYISPHIVHRSLKIVDAEGLELHKRQKLRRHVFHCEGRNKVWSLNGHDKLEWWGFPIHGCCDVYSRYLLWLRVGITNNDPRCILTYYLDSIEELSKIRSQKNCIAFP